MKRLLTILSEVFLFCFLLVILITPVIVSLNLDPELYEEKVNVAGVSNVKSGGMDFVVTETFADLEGVKVLNYDHVNNAYFLALEVTKQIEFDKVYHLFEFENQNDKNLNFVAQMFANDGLNDVKVFFVAGSNEGLLFDGKEFREVTFTQGVEAKTQVGLKFVASSSLNYKIPIKLELRSVNVSN